jgi:hypothetical protein
MKKTILIGVSALGLIASSHAFAQAGPAESIAPATPESPFKDDAANRTMPAFQLGVGGVTNSYGNGLESAGDDIARDASCAGSTNCSTVKQEAGASDSSGNEAEVTQNGSLGYADVTQNGLTGMAARNNRADIEQNGAGDNRAKVVQQGQQSLAQIKQTNAGGAANQVNVLQESPDAGGPAVAGYNAAAGFTASKVADITQDGSGNSAKLRQADQSYNNNGVNSGQNQLIKLDQAGTDNRFEGVQTDANSSILANQYAGSSNNSIRAEQLGANGNAAGSSAVINQEGSDNISFSRQYANGGASLTVDQDGVDNFSAVEQGSDRAAGGETEMYVRHSSADIDQIGNGNTSLISQRGFTNVAGWDSASGADARVLQNGDNNTAVVQQIGGSPSAQFKALNQQATVEQYGTVAGAGNTANVFQTDADNNANNQVANIYQGANGASVEGNSATIEQRGASAVDYDPLNSATITQTADGNSGSIFQAGGQHIATITQTDIGNQAITDQSGVGNTANVYQYSADNMSTVTQGGSGNIATVTQGVAP